MRGSLKAMFAPESGDSGEDGAENCADFWPLNHFLFLKVAGAISCQRGRLQLYYVYGSIISDSRLSGLSTSPSSSYGFSRTCEVNAALSLPRNGTKTKQINTGKDSSVQAKTVLLSCQEGTVPF